MSQSQYVKGFGSVISYATYTPGAGSAGATIGTYTKVAQSVDINTPSTEVGDIKITNNDSPNNSHEYAPGLTEPGDLEFQVVYVKTMHETVLNMCGNGTIYAFEETLSDGTVATFTGYWKSATIETKTEDGAAMGKLKIKLCTAVVYA